MPFIFGAPRSRTSTLIVDSDIVMTPGNIIQSSAVAIDALNGLTAEKPYGYTMQNWHIEPRDTPIEYTSINFGYLVASQNFAFYSIFQLPPRQTISGELWMYYTNASVTDTLVCVSEQWEYLARISINSTPTQCIIPPGTCGIYAEIATAGSSLKLDISKFAITPV